MRPSCSRNYEQSKALNAQNESHASFGLIFDVHSGTFLSQDRLEYSLSTTNQNENIQVVPKRIADNLAIIKGFRSELGTVSEVVPGYNSSSLKSNSKYLHGTGRERDEINESKNDNFHDSRNEKSTIPPKNSAKIRGKDERERGDDTSTLRLPEEAPTPARIPPPSSYNSKKPVTSIPTNPTPTADETPGSHSALRSSSGPSASNFSEAKTPLAKHDKSYGHSSSGNGGSTVPTADSGISPGSGHGSSSSQRSAIVSPPTPTRTSLATQSNQQILHTPIMHNNSNDNSNNNNNNNNNKSSSSSSNNKPGSKVQSTPLSPGLVPLNPNPNNQHRGYLDMNNIVEGEYDKSKISSTITQKIPDFESFLGSYKVSDPSWAQGLDLNVSSLLMHSSDSQVLYYMTNSLCGYYSD